MAISVPFPPPSTGGPISGELIETFTDTTHWQIGLWYQNAAGTWQFNTWIPVAPVWSFGLAQAGTGYAAAVMAIGGGAPPSTPPPLGPTVANVTRFPPNRLSLGTAAGTVSGTVTGLGAPASFRVRLYGAGYGSGWGFVADSAVSEQGGWSVSTSATPLQWAAVLVGPGWTENPEQAALGLLPDNGTNTTFGGGIRVRVGAWPGAGGGPLDGMLVGLARSTGLVAYVLSEQADGRIVQAQTEMHPNGTFGFDAVRRGTRYAVVISVDDRLHFMQFPAAVGGRVITWAVSP